VNKHWAPIKQISSHLGNMITKDMKVLELGPSIIINESNKLPNYKIVDFSKDKFPYVIKNLILLTQTCFRRFI